MELGLQFHCPRIRCNLAIRRCWSLRSQHYFFIGWILADARVLTRSLWLPIGLHAGWIFGSGAFSRVARQQTLALPWLGKNMLVGIVPLGRSAVLTGQ